jgi:asparagine synthase (glutamine-hydrolysing)
MCGICGIATADPRASVDAGLLDRMASVLAHRGPDGHGAFRAPGIGLGVRRLAINDLRTGAQPISNEDDTVTVVCNGEIYNFRELRRDLQTAGHAFRTASDVEVIVHLYEDHGVDCVSRLRGMFAFALWDRRRRRLMLARDRLGIKPLLYALGAGACIFASEQKAILETQLVQRQVDLPALRDVFTFGFVRSPRTLMGEIRHLSPGHILLYEDGQVTPRRYWDLAFPPRGKGEPGSAATWIEAFRAKLEESVALHLRSDVPLGAWLSPGVDSSSIVSLMSGALHDPVRTFSLGFENHEVDELRRQPTLDQFPDFHLSGRRVTCRASDLARLPHALWHGEDLIGNSILIPRMVLAEASARERKVVLAGEGADELLGGYPWFALDRLLRPLAGLPLPVRQAMLLGSFLPRRWPWASQLLVGPRELNLDRFRRLVGLAHGEVLEQLLSRDLQHQLAECDPRSEELERPAGFTRWHPFTQLQYYELKVRLPDRILYSVDRASMAYGLEVRVPFLDHELVELCARMPRSLKMRGWRNKYVLRQAMQGRLPGEVVTRRKYGLRAPTSAWLGGALPDFATTLLSPGAIREKGYFDAAAVESLLRRHRSGDRRYADHLFAVLGTQLWDEIFRRGRRSAWIRSGPPPVRLAG